MRGDADAAILHDPSRKSLIERRVVGWAMRKDAAV